MSLRNITILSIEMRDNHSSRLRDLTRQTSRNYVFVLLIFCLKVRYCKIVKIQLIMMFEKVWRVFTK